MKILITSGGTTQPIDSVRGITNHSTGELGQKIAQLFLDKGHEVTLVTTPKSLRPEKHEALTIEEILTVEQLLTHLEPLVKKHDVLIHSMAVSDYTPVYMTNIEELERSENPRQLLSKENTEKKISSASDYQVLFLKKTPKVISEIKKWNPQILLIGFKLLVNVSKEELLKVARKSLITNQATYILANDLQHIDEKKHQAYLVDQTQEYLATTKKDIAKLIFEKVIHSKKGDL